MRKLLIFLLICLPFLSLGTRKFTTEEYIKKFKKVAQKEMKLSKIPASITLAQGILESGSGNSTLARKANNHFGIKCHSDWKKKSVTHDDDEKNECFRKYRNPYKSYLDHSDFLTGKSRYSKLFKLNINDYEGWAYGLKKAGYATHPDYATMLISIIKKYNLSQYDIYGKRTVKAEPQFASKKIISTPLPNLDSSISQENIEQVSPLVEQLGANVVAANTEILREELDEINKTIDRQECPVTYRLTPECSYMELLNGLKKDRIFKNNGVKYIIAKENETLPLIAEAYNIPINNIFIFNDIKIGEGAVDAGSRIYLDIKRGKSQEVKTHVVKEGETLWGIAQKYGIRLASIRRKNMMRGKEYLIKVNDEIWLQKKKDEIFNQQDLQHFK